jgi:hypothetical protein
MSQQLLDQLRNKSEELHNIYGSRFAGYSRLTRDLGEMDDLVKKAKGLLEESAGLQGAAAEEVLALLRERMDLYEREYKLIAQAKEASQEEREAAELGNRANRVFQVYRRHFAGHNRATRDLGVLAEMIEDLTGIQAQMTALSRRYESDGLRRDIDVVKSNLEMYLTERGEITEARNSGSTSDQADRLAALANDQFAIYQKHFAGRSRRTRRPQLLQRIVNNLVALRDRMRTLSQSGLRDATHDENARVVSNQIDFYSGELAQILKTRQDTSVEDLAGALGNDANTIMQEYRDNFAGQNRATRDVALLTLLCDRLHEIERQMDDIAQRHPQVDFNPRNLQIVRDNMTLYNRELDAIKDAQKPKA